MGFYLDQLVYSYRRFGTAYRYNPQGSSSQGSTVLGNSDLTQYYHYSQTCEFFSFMPGTFTRLSGFRQFVYICALHLTHVAREGL
jgi:hypothetical protein